MGVDLGSAHGSIEIDVAKAMANVGQLQGTLNAFGKSTTGALKSAQSAGLVLAGAGGAILGAFGLATKTAADFEQQMSAVSAVTGATGKQFDALRETALRIGKDTAFSASEAAAAIEELGKAGVSTEDILNGAADGATALAAAAGIGIPEAATAIANALNVFGLAGDQATHVADVFAAAANKSATDVSQLQQALAQSGTVAAQFGLTIEDTAGALALFADNGLKGADAGTSLKTMFLSLLDPTQKQADEMDKLGISFFDAQGNFVGLAKMADLLQGSMKDLSQQQRETALAILFGSDAVRAGSILYDSGGKKVRDYTDAVDDAGAAHDAAAKRLDNFNGALEQLRGSLQTLAIVVGSVFLPAAKDLVDGATRIVNAFLGLPKPIQEVGAVAGVAAGAVSALAGGFVLLAPKVLEAVKAFEALAPLLAGIAPEVAVVVAALGALAVAYKTNFLGFADAVHAGAATIKAGLGRIGDAAAVVTPALKALFTTPFQARSGGKFTTQFANIQAATRALTVAFGLTGDQAREVQSALTDMAKPARQLRNTFKDVATGAHEFFDVLTGGADTKHFLDFQKRMRRLFGKDIGPKVVAQTLKLRTAMQQLGKSFKAATRIDFSHLLTLPGVLEVVAKATKGLADVLRTDLIPALGPVFLLALKGATAALTFLADHMDTIVHVVGTVARLVGETLAAPFRVLAALLRGDVAGALDVVTGLLGDFLAAGADLAGWVLDVAAPQVVAWTADLWDWLKTDGLPGFFDLAGDLAGWVLNVAAPQVIAWAADVFAWAMDQVFGTRFTMTGDGTEMTTSRAQRLADWVLDVAAPKVIGWLLDTAGDAFRGAADLAGWALTKGAVAAGWVLAVGAPRIGGWVLATAHAAWPAVRDLAGWSLDKGEEAGGWLLSVAAPRVDLPGFGDAVVGAIATAWNLAKAAGIALGGWVIAAGAWVVEEGEPVAAAVLAVLPGFWNAAKQTATELAGWTISAVGWVVEEGEDLAAAMMRNLPGWWNAAKGTATELGGWTIKAGGWLVEEARAGELQSLITDHLHAWTDGYVFTLADWKLVVANPAQGIEVTLDVGAVWDKVRDGITGPDAKAGMEGAAQAILEGLATAMGAGAGASAGVLADAGLAILGGIATAIKNPDNATLLLRALSGDGGAISQLVEKVDFRVDAAAIAQKWWDAFEAGFAAFTPDIDLGGMIHDALFGGKKTVDLPFVGGVKTPFAEDGGIFGQLDQLKTDLETFFTDLDFSDIAKPSFPTWMDTPDWFAPVKTTWDTITSFADTFLIHGNPITKILDAFSISKAEAAGGNAPEIDQSVASNLFTLAGAIDEAVARLQEAPEKIRAAMQGIIDAFAQGTPGAPGFGGGAGGTIPLADQFTTLGQTVVTSIGAGIDAGVAAGTLATAMAGVADAITTASDAFAIGTGGGSAYAIGDNIAVEIGGGMEDGAAGIGASSTVLTDAVFAVWQPFLATGTDLGTELGGNYADGIGTAADAAAAAAGNLVAAALGSMQAGTGAAFADGSNIGSSFAAGVASQAAAAARAGADLADAAAGGTSAAAKIGSPSKVFIDLGKQMGLGLALGLKQSATAITRAGERLAGQALPPSRTATLGAMPTGGGGGGFVDARRFYALHSDDFARLLAGAEMGGDAFGWILRRETAYATVGA